MEGFATKQEEKLFRALQSLLHNSVDKIGLPKKATIKQLMKAKRALTDYENFNKQHRAIGEGLKQARKHLLIA